MSLTREDLRKLCQVLLAELETSLEEFRPTGDFDEFSVTSHLLWRDKIARVRLFHRSVTQTDVSDLEGVVMDSGSAEGVIVEAAEPGDARSTPNVHVLRYSEFLDLLRECALVDWSSGAARPQIERFRQWSTLALRAPVLDPVGLKWLPSLALNRMPPTLPSGAVSADALFERIAFRLLTTVFRLRGWRLGARQRGQRLPDAVIMSARGSSAPFGALLDCKAAQGGYVMTADHERRFVEYVLELRSEVERHGVELDYMLIISSGFPGQVGARHPFYARAQKIKAVCGVNLAYIRAVDLVRLAVDVEAQEASPAAREAIDWTSILDQGLVDDGVLKEAFTRGSS